LNEIIFISSLFIIDLQMTISEFSSFVKQSLSGVYDNGEVNALLKNLLLERLSFSFYEQSKHENDVLSVREGEMLMNDLNRLKLGEPLQYVLGYAWFNEMKIIVDKNVLIPRPETEELISFILDQRFPDGAVMMDICSGSGCIALALKSSFPTAHVFGADVSEEALEVSRANSKFLELKVHWLKWNVLEEDAPENFNQSLDLIVSNPPYVSMHEIEEMSKNVIDFEPHLALFVPDNDPLLFYKKIAHFSVSRLKSGGRLWVEINKRFAVEVAELFEKIGFTDVRIYRDFSDNDRFVSAVKI